MNATSKNDVVQLLLDQHAEIRKLFTQVENASGETRREKFDELRALLAVHETAEEEVVHPFSRGVLGKTSAEVDAIIGEEEQAKHVLKRLEKVGTGSPEFLPLFRELHDAVEKHARHEEREEFPRLRERAEPDELAGLATMVRAAEAVAPTHPHPGTDSATKNLIAGPMAAVADRARDAIRKARH
ncbi:hemerythrin domain-containing protein [Actinocorallia longicatena]|uniref:Hemerythrin domain-containing protein n=1 Tax=Actinocorallia longicatena TaxID=111803 RepID=A0ABP6QA67_9ACTN